MKWIATATLLLVLAGGLLAAGPDEDYLAIYNQIQSGDALEQARQYPAAAARYQQALVALTTFHKDHPASNAAAVNYRLEYLQEKLQEPQLKPFVVASTNLVPAATMPAAPAMPRGQTNVLQEQIRFLTNANAQLQMQLNEANAKLQEALKIQPAAAAPGALDAARKQIISLEKERDLLRVTLDQLKAAPPAETKPSASTEADKTAQAEIASLKQMLNETERKLSDTAAELNNLKSRPPAQPPVAENLAQLTAERDSLKKQLADVSKELADSEAHANSAPATAGADAAKLKAVEAERDGLKKQVEAMTAAAGSGASAGSGDELAGLRARLAVLEAAPVPYTAQELALMKAAPSTPVAAPPAAVKEPSPKAHSSKDLSASAKAIMRDANLDIMARRYADAEKKYAQVLQEDESNIFVLCMLGSAQFSDGHPDDCEKTVRRALALDPNDAGNLYLLGVLRYSQEKFDDALDALSRSAAVNSTNASTQFYLGSVLSQKGLRSEAETALRKALIIDPNYADAHFALAVIYAAQKSMALARWEYERAVDMGHDKSPDLEKALSGGN